MTEGSQHQVLLINRQQLSLTGVTHVVHFEATQIILETLMGIMQLQGEEMKINHLNLEQNKLDVVGQIKSISYSDEQGTKYVKSRSGKLWRRLLK